MSRHLIVLFSLLILSSCQKKRVFDIPKTNRAILNSTGIDILKFKEKIDKRFTNSSFYLEECESIAYSNRSHIYEEFGPIICYDNGDTIKIKSIDTITRNVAQSIAQNISVCDDTSELFCRSKNQFKTNLENIDGMYQLSPTNTSGQLLVEYRNGFYNYEELSYMSLVFHLLSSFDHLSQ